MRIISRLEKSWDATHKHMAPTWAKTCWTWGPIHFLKVDPPFIFRNNTPIHYCWLITHIHIYTHVQNVYMSTYLYMYINIYYRYVYVYIHINTHFILAHESRQIPIVGWYSIGILFMKLTHERS